jgi:peroxiredoxin
MIAVNDKAPDFSLEGDDGKLYRLSEHLGERVLLVFYPGDNTPVCTRQLCEYRDGIESFADLGVSVVGISSDDLESHRDFRSKHDLPFVLLSDQDLDVAKLYGCKGDISRPWLFFGVAQRNYSKPYGSSIGKGRLERKRPTFKTGT